MDKFRDQDLLMLGDLNGLGHLGLIISYHMFLKCIAKPKLSRIYPAPSRSLGKGKYEERLQRRTKGQNRINRWRNGDSKIAQVSARSACLSEDVSQGRQMQQLISKAGTSPHILSVSILYVYIYIMYVKSLYLYICIHTYTCVYRVCFVWKDDLSIQSCSLATKPQTQRDRCGTT